MNKLTEVFQKGGGWIYSLAVLVLLFGAGFQGSLWGSVSVVAGALLILLDPFVLILSKKFERTHSIAWGSGFLAVLFYLARSSMEMAPGQEDPLLSRLRSVLLLFFVLSLILSVMLRIGLTLSYNASSVLEGKVHRQRDQYLKTSVFSILIAITLFVVANYIAAVRNPSIDLTPGYYSFSDPSSRLIDSIQGKIQIYAFLPVQQAVAGDKSYTLPELYRISEDIRVTLQQLPNINPSIEVEFLNAELNTDRLEEFGSVTNGTIIIRSLSQDNKTELTRSPFTERRVFIRTERDMDRLEKDVVRALVQVSSPGKKIYFTGMNGERITFNSDMDRVGGVGTLKEKLSFYNFETSILDHESGWPGKIPDDADVLAITGPTVPFSEVAKQSILDYLKGGGRLFVAVDPTGGEDFNWLMEALHTDYRMKNGLVENLSGFRDVLATDHVQKHRVTESLQVAGKKPVVVFPLGGVFLQDGSAVSSDQAVRTLPRVGATPFLFTPYHTLLDENKNHKQDPGEQTGRYPLGLAFESQAESQITNESGESSGDSSNESSGDQTRKGSEGETNHPGRDQNPGGEQDLRIVLFSGVEWITDRGLTFPLKKVNESLAADAFFFLTESPLAGSLQNDRRESRRVQVSEDLKFRNILFGMILFPLVVGGGMGLAVFLFRKRRRFAGELDGAR